MLSAVSALRVTSERYSAYCGMSTSDDSGSFAASDCTACVTVRTGRSAGSGANEATAKAPPPPVSSRVATAAVMRFGCF